MRTTRQKKILTLCILLGVCTVCVIIGFAVVASPVKITFHADGGEFVQNIKGTPAKKLDLPKPVKPGYRFEGWSTSATSNKFVEKINKKKMDLYAVWTQIDVVASLYINGEYLRDVTIPPVGDPEQGNGRLGNDVDIGNDTNSVDLKGPLILTEAERTRFGVSNSSSGNFRPNGFIGWTYYDEMYNTISRTSNKIDLRCGDSRSAEWRIWRNENISESAVVRNTNPFNPSGYDPSITSGYKVALNAIVEYRQLDIEFRGIDGVRINAVAPAGGSRIERLNTALVLNQFYAPPVGHTLVGWRLGDINDDNVRADFNESNIYAHGSTVFLDPKLWALCTGKTAAYPTLTFYAVTVPSFLTPVRYEKRFENGQFTYRNAGVAATVTIDDRTAVDTLPVVFDFAGGYRNKLKSTTTTITAGTDVLSINPIDVDKKSYPSATNAQARRTFYVQDNVSRPEEVGTVRLPLANSYAVGGMVFEGWKNSLDGKVYPAGLIYRVPLGTTKLSFTAVWKSTRELVSFDLDGGRGSWKASSYYKKPGQNITLPRPTRYGYNFKGWSDGARDSSGNLVVTHNGGASFPLQTQKQRLIALWEAKTIGRVSLHPIQGKTHRQFLNIEFGTVIKLSNMDGTASGWRFPDRIKSTKNREVFMQFEFGAPFVVSMYIEINEAFCITHTGSRDERRLLSPTDGGANILGLAFA